ncbi:hypothetical protein L1987_22662 [Smallanthus sonchifolius]|uniref:Uncharacterized protein n=1 Tax=Smallanthus sonchifolius TaxID=185202 RepID=A0ACB9IGV2_9ASTR|nr:hypothetical protein L1987_22662 [Smallanthus sonchifolius]
MKWRDPAAPFSFKAPKREEYDEQLYATLTSFQHPIRSYPEHFLIMARISQNWGDPRGWPSAAIGEMDMKLESILRKRRLHSITCQSEELKKGSPSFNDLTARNFELRMAVLVPQAGVEEMQDTEHEESGRETEEPISRKNRVARSAGGAQQQVDNVLANIEKQLNADETEHSETGPGPQPSAGTLDMNPEHVSLSSTSDPVKKDADKEALGKMEGGDPTAGRGKDLVMEGDGLSLASDEWFDVGGTKDRSSRMIVPEQRYEIHRGANPGLYARPNAWVAELHHRLSEVIEENKKLVDRDMHVDVSKEKVSEVEKLKKHVEQGEERCTELEKQYQQMTTGKSLSTCLCVNGVIPEKVSLVQEREWWFREGFELLARWILASPVLMTCVGTLNNATGDMRFASGLATGYEYATKKIPIEDVPEQPENPDEAVDAAVAAFEAVQIPLW